MSDFQSKTDGPKRRPWLRPGRSSGLKLIIVCALVVLMAIPAMFISYISYERSHRANEVTRDVSADYGGPQLITGPQIVVPYIRQNDDARIFTMGDYVFSPDIGRADLPDIKTDEVSLSLFKVPVFKSDGSLSARFTDPRRIDLDDRLKLDWSQAKIVFNLSQVKGLRGDIAMTVNGKSYQFSYQDIRRPDVPSWTRRIHNKDEEVIETKHVYKADYDILPTDNGRYLAISAAPLFAQFDAGKTEVDSMIKLSLSGAQRLSVTPFGKLTEVNMASNWPHPGFDGPYPPDSREITESGFKASWTIPMLRRGIASHGSASNFTALYHQNGAMSVNFVSPLNPYRTVNRALKYSVLFIGMVFLAYFLFEVIVGVPVHPAQYILIGLAQSIFYLLLLAFSERIGFTGAFAISAGATIAATAGYAGAVFGGRSYIVKTGIVFALVYGLLYSLMRMQDFALMIGALASFIAIAAVMYLTRNINWYGERKVAT